MTTFRTTILLEGKTATGAPGSCRGHRRARGGKQPLVHVAIGDYRYRSKVGVRGGRALVPISARASRGRRRGRRRRDRPDAHARHRPARGRGAGRPAVALNAAPAHRRSTRSPTAARRRSRCRSKAQRRRRPGPASREGAGDPDRVRRAERDQRGEQEALDGDVEQRRVRLLVVAAGEPGERERVARAARAGSSCPPRRARRPRRTSPPSSAPGGPRRASGHRPSPALAKPCATPGGASTTSPGPATKVRRPSRKRTSPASTSKRSVWIGCTCGTGTLPPGRSAKSKASSSPSVLAAVCVKVKRSPVTGFEIVWPGEIMPRLRSRRSCGRTRRSRAGRGRARAGRRPAGACCGRRGPR